jgi:hypothetical protein
MVTMSDDPLVLAMQALRRDVLDELDKIHREIAAIRHDIALDMGSAEVAREQLSVMNRRMLKLEADIRDLKGEP